MEFNVEKCNIRTGEFSIVERIVPCCHCAERTPVFALYLKGALASVRHTRYQGGRSKTSPWEPSQSDLFPNFIMAMPQTLAEYLGKVSDGNFHWERFRRPTEDDPGFGYYLNHCRECGYRQADVGLFDDPGKGFYFENYQQLQNALLTYPVKDVTADLYLQAECVREAPPMVIPLECESRKSPPKKMRSANPRVLLSQMASFSSHMER